MSSIVFQVQSFIIVAVLLYGVSKRKQRFLHMKIMKFAIIWDLLLVAQIELNRSAIATALKIRTNPALLNIHISLAVSTVVLYAIVAYTGKKLHSGDNSIRKWHRPIGILTLIIRISTLITSNLI